MIDHEPLFQGGCGHSAQEVEDAVWGCGWIFFVFLVLAVIFGVCSILD